MAEKTKEDIEAIQSLEQVEKEEEAVIDEIAEVAEGKKRTLYSTTSYALTT